MMQEVNDKDRERWSNGGEILIDEKRHDPKRRIYAFKENSEDTTDAEKWDSDEEMSQAALSKWHGVIRERKQQEHDWKGEQEAKEREAEETRKREEKDRLARERKQIQIAFYRNSGRFACGMYRSMELQRRRTFGRLRNVSIDVLREAKTNRELGKYGFGMV
jgi:hypothetical protein